MEEFCVTCSFNAVIAGEVKTNLFVRRFTGGGWTDGLVKFGRKSGVLRGGNRVAEWKTGESRLVWSPEAIAAQDLMNEERL